MTANIMAVSQDQTVSGNSTQTLLTLGIDNDSVVMETKNCLNSDIKLRRGNNQKMIIWLHMIFAWIGAFIKMRLCLFSEDIKLTWRFSPIWKHLIVALLGIFSLLVVTAFVWVYMIYPWFYPDNLKNEDLPTTYIEHHH